MRTYSIVVADDHAVVRRGVRQLLEAEPGWRVVAEASSGQEAVDKTLQYRPDLVVMDISMPVLNGLDATRMILKELPHTRVLILSVHDAEELIEKTLEVGASGYVLKSDAEADLVTAVDAVLHHQTYFTSAASQLVLERLRGFHPQQGKPHLTVREVEVIQLLVEGNSNKQAAAILGLSQRTVENYRARIMQKLDLHSFSDLIRYAIHHKIVNP